MWLLITQISGGWRHTMALTSDGKLFGWGWNKVGFSGNAKVWIGVGCSELWVGMGRWASATIRIIAFLCKSNFQMSRHIIFPCDVAFFHV
ncbi:Regulator of chromosome condensation 1/beta-lactamase-inhibitor protein II [Cynara cardunculus var. scolymus]|uniref:Regulator of chromosome condensation 1/beta-lactamase-inhibitor protein II n=1 Tax=Cynara cardunculus var. scolymus TaxID=59895 RepID=A0A118JRQ7_CYNCS|nr:Regulator of chromosome condensation 1/beta-lactamase-inhibitor protein II [Cynara cardunculus var. scolymus]